VSPTPSVFRIATTTRIRSQRSRPRRSPVCKDARHRRKRLFLQVACCPARQSDTGTLHWCKPSRHEHHCITICLAISTHSAAQMIRDTELRRCHARRLPDFTAFLARARWLRVVDHAHAHSVPKLLHSSANSAPGARLSTNAKTRPTTSGPPVSCPPGTESSLGASTRRSLLRLAPAHVRMEPDGRPQLPMATPALPKPTKRTLQRHQRCEIVLRVLGGERQAHLAKEFGVTRAAVSYLLRNTKNVFQAASDTRRP
jgi:hypothetical protein